MNPAAPYNILLIMQLVNMEQYSWLMEDTHLKEGWKSVWMDCGALSVTQIGQKLNPVLSATNLDF